MSGGPIAVGCAVRDRVTGRVGRVKRVDHSTRACVVDFAGDEVELAGGRLRFVAPTWASWVESEARGPRTAGGRRGRG